MAKLSGTSLAFQMGEQCQAQTQGGSKWAAVAVSSEWLALVHNAAYDAILT